MMGINADPSVYFGSLAVNAEASVYLAHPLTPEELSNTLQLLKIAMPFDIRRN